MIIKVIYFDEGSATDLIHLSHGGIVEEVEKSVSQKSSQIYADAKAKLASSFKWLPFIKTEIAASTEFEMSFSGNKMIEKAITNTILTDYVKLAEKEADFIKVFNSINVKPYKESITYMKIITPYMLMTEGKYKLDSDMNLNIAKMDEAFENGKGYYELIVNENNIDYVLRFNIKAFRNNYVISDLTKMKLTYHAIEVGKIDLDRLNMKYEFDVTEHKPTSGIDVAKDSVIEKKKVKVFDVILAGINHE